MIANLWVIRHKPTNNYLPNPPFRSANGHVGSHVEPVPPHVNQPRTFDTERAAKSALGHWLRGRVTCTRNWDGDEDIKLVRVPHRKRKEMEIVPVVLVHKDF